MQSGQLFVSGKNKVIINLKGHPDKVSVHFHGHSHVVPCNHHHHHDSLEWEVIVDNKHDHIKYTLIIKWNVTDVRQIKWEACY